MALMKAFLRLHLISSSLRRHTSTVTCADSGASADSELHNLSSLASAEAEKAVRNGPRNDWTKPEIQSVYNSPIMDLLFHGGSPCPKSDSRIRVSIEFRFPVSGDLVGGIIGLGEQVEDRVGLLHTLATLPEHPESVPINALLAVKGTPLQDQKCVFSQPVEIWEMIRMIETARIVMPKAMVRSSAGRVRFSLPEQALCFLAGANSIFTGEKLLTTPNNDFDADQRMFKLLGLIPKAASIVGEIKCEAKETVENDADSEHDEAAAVNSR